MRAELCLVAAMLLACCARSTAQSCAHSPCSGRTTNQARWTSSVHRPGASCSRTTRIRAGSSSSLPTLPGVPAPVHPDGIANCCFAGLCGVHTKLHTLPPHQLAYCGLGSCMPVSRLRSDALALCCSSRSLKYALLLQYVLVFLVIIYCFPTQHPVQVYILSKCTFCVHI